MNPVKIGNKFCGANTKPYTIAEIGINHNGSLETAFKLIDLAVDAGFDAVKFQKRDLSIVYTPEELLKPRENFYGATNGDLKRGLEFDYSDYEKIQNYCDTKSIDWFASPWDLNSLAFLEKFNVVAHKVASACLTDANLLKAMGKTGKPIILSTGMSSLNQVRQAVELIGHDQIVILHCVSTYPAKNSDLNLSVINTLKTEFSLPVGYSGHEVGVLPSVLAVSTYGARMIERHITLDRSMWGSDQSASLESTGAKKLISYINESYEVIGSPEKKIYDFEIGNLEKLRRVKDF